MKNSRIIKTLALIIAISMITAFTACGEDKNTSNNKTDTTTSTQTKPTNDDTVSIVEFEDDEEGVDITTTTTTKTTTKKTTTTTAAPKRDNSYKVTAKTYESTDGKVKVSYPQISGLYDEKMQKYYNKLFKSDFADYMKDDFKDTFENTYKVTYKTKDILSIVFRCNTYIEGSAHPMAFAYAYTINLETGETLMPSVDIDTASAAKNFLSDKSWTLTRAEDRVSKSDVIEYYNKYSVDEIEEYLTETDVFTVSRSKKGVYSTDGTISCRSYLDGSAAPIFILDVPHALGDYVEIEFH